MRSDGSITTSHTGYIQGVQPMSHRKLIGKPPEEEVDAATTTESKPVYIAIAHATMTHVHSLLYVVALQRNSHALSFMTKNPKVVRDDAMARSRTLVAHSDPGFTKEQEKGYGVRAANHLRQGISAPGQVSYHFLQARQHQIRRCSRC